MINDSSGNSTSRAIPVFCSEEVGRSDIEVMADLSNRRGPQWGRWRFEWMGSSRMGTRPEYGIPPTDGYYKVYPKVYHTCKIWRTKNTFGKSVPGMEHSHPGGHCFPLAFCSQFSVTLLPVAFCWCSTLAKGFQQACFHSITPVGLGPDVASRPMRDPQNRQYFVACEPTI